MAELLLPGTSDFAGEDRTYGGHALYVDLIPETAFYQNARDALSRSAWRDVSRVVRSRVRECEGCGTHATPDLLEAHERWRYDEATGVQKLMRLIALCRRCHRATHYGLAEMRGWDREARAHLAVVNGWTPDEVRAHINDAIREWRQRSERAWVQDLSILGIRTHSSSRISS